MYRLTLIVLRGVGRDMSLRERLRPVPPTRVFAFVSVSFVFRFRACVLSQVEIFG